LVLLVAGNKNDYQQAVCSIKLVLDVLALGRPKQDTPPSVRVPLDEDGPEIRVG